jgi:lipoprotein-releasing system permease protein
MNRSEIQVLNALYALQEHNDIRPAEMERLIEMLQIIDASAHDEAADTFRFAAGQRAAFLVPLTAVLEANAAQLDTSVHQQLKGAILPKEATIVGVFQSSMMVKMPDLFLPLPLAQQLAGLGDSVQGVAIRVDDPYLVEQSLATLQSALGNNWLLSTWMEQYAPFFALINQQRVMMYFVLSFIVLISAFSMMAVMFTVTIQKRREIGVMKALGATPWQIMQVFLYQGSMLGLAGAALGVGLGRLVVHYRDLLQTALRHLHFDPFSARLTGFQTLPAHMNPSEQLGIALMGLFFCMLASLLPACVAARSDAAKSLRNG